MLKSIELSGFKSFAKKSVLDVGATVVAIVGPNGSGKSNSAEAFRFVLGEQSIKSMRGRRGEDLIWGGTDMVPRANRASVRVCFNNRSRLLDIAFDEVLIERTVHRDGSNEYFINGSRVRLKDITALLAGANIGSSGHNIISQGESDRILNASISERKDMLEDALGLKVFQYKKSESQKKLGKTYENVKEIESARRELTPRLKFLEGEMRKREFASELRGELAGELAIYLAREDAYIKLESSKLSTAKDSPAKELNRLDQELAECQKVKQNSEDKEALSVLTCLNQEIDSLVNSKSKHTRELGRLEGQLTFLRSDMSRRGAVTHEHSVEWSAVEQFTNKIAKQTQTAQSSRDTEVLRTALRNVRVDTDEFLQNVSGERNTREQTPCSSENVQELEQQKQKLEELLANLTQKEAEAESKREDIKADIEKQKSKGKDTQLKVLEISAKRSAVCSELANIERDSVALARRRRAFTEELREGVALLGRVAGDYKNVSTGNLGEYDTDSQETDRRKIERMKIKLEEMGVVGNDTVEEHKSATERDEFLTKELTDLKNSTKSLESLIESLENELSIKFRDGLEKVNEEFQKFFTVLFGGGRAELNLTKRKKSKIVHDELSGLADEKDEYEYEEGVNVSVHLPRKKASSLEILSGGERALTSIAIIFAMSAVNPPPFLVLDETDAALDEANSKRYADMVRVLADKSQLILITHNRETMAAASELYGVTMGADGVSRLLSVKLDEAVTVAK